jgi:hypothetical protein
MTYCLSKFAVLDDYCEKKIEGEKGWNFWLVLYNDFNLLKAKFTNQRFYNPLEEAKELYMELNKVNLKKPESLMKFISVYGIPAGNKILGGNDEMKAFFQMNLMKDFIFKFVDLQKIIRYWKAIKEDDQETLEKAKKSFTLDAVGEQIEEYKKHEDYFVKNPDSGIEQLNEDALNAECHNIFMKVKDQKLKDIVIAYITVLLNKQSFGEIKTTVVDVPCKEKKKIVMKKKIVDAISFNDLFEVAFYQLRQAIFNDMQIKTCEHCGFPFEVTHERQRFCPPLFGKKRSNCENTYNQRIRRKTKKENVGTAE